MNAETAAAAVAVHDIIPSEALAGNAVVNRADEELGTLAHIMLDVPGGRIAYAVLGCGGVFGIGERLHAVPWSALELDSERQCFVLDIERQRLDGAPRFDREHWPSMNDPRWALEVHQYFGVRPYWSP